MSRAAARVVGALMIVGALAGLAKFLYGNGALVPFLLLVGKAVVFSVWIMGAMYLLIEHGKEER